MKNTEFYVRREYIKNKIANGEGLWSVNPLMFESEIAAWINYMERLESELDAQRKKIKELETEVSNAD
jgi:hypothetical protein